MDVHCPSLNTELLGQMMLISTQGQPEWLGVSGCLTTYQVVTASQWMDSKVDVWT